MTYLVKIDEFEGPLDLLLHLIKTSEKEIFEVSISEITSQYLEYLKAMDDLELNYAAEYLVMAAELVNIKAVMLLPKPKLEESEYEEDPREKLLARLVEYQQYKEASNTFSQFKIEREDYFTRFASYVESVDIVSLDDSVDMYDLLKAIQKMNQRKQMEKPLTTVIEKGEISVEERMLTLTNSLKLKKQQNFSSLFEHFDKGYVITTFLAVLELVKENKVVISKTTIDDFAIEYIGR